jgi:hypothetical protein
MLANAMSGVLEVISRLRQGARTRWAALRNELYIILAWILVTWGIFQLNPRAWAISIGIYLCLNAGLATYAETKRDVRNSV